MPWPSGISLKNSKCCLISENQSVSYSIHFIRTMNEQNHLIISIDTEKASDKIQHLFMIKINSWFKNLLSKMGIEVLLYDKRYLSKTRQLTLYSMMKAQKLSLCNLGNKIRMSTFTTAVQHGTGSSSQNN